MLRAECWNSMIKKRRSTKVKKRRNAHGAERLTGPVNTTVSNLENIPKH
jgi:hypothetical protein